MARERRTGSPEIPDDPKKMKIGVGVGGTFCRALPLTHFRKKIGIFARRRHAVNLEKLHIDQESYPIILLRVWLIELIRKNLISFYVVVICQDFHSAVL